MIDFFLSFFLLFLEILVFIFALVLGKGDESIFNTPRSLAIAPDNTIYVADTANCRVCFVCCLHM